MAYEERGHPALQRDAGNPDDPTSVFGLILHGLKARKAAGIAPYTVMSCDNIPHNGVVTRSAVAGLARLMDPQLAEWVEAHVSFPNAMVDRITPATSDRERQMAKDMFDIEDTWPVFCEEYIQWVIDGHFTAGRPTFEKVGVQFVHEAMQHPQVHGFFEKVEQEEIIPTVPPVPNTNIQDYCKLIDRRFSNPKIGDTERRLCLDGSNRQPKFIVPVIADNLAAGRTIKGLALESALWCRYCYGTTDSGQVIEPNDPVWDRLQALSHKAKDDPVQWLTMDDIYGDVGKSDVMRAEFAAALNSLWTNGTAATLKSYIG